MLPRLASLMLAFLLAAAAGCGGSGPSQEEFESQVRETRDRTDTALENVTTATNWDELLLRVRAASDQTNAAAEDLDEVGAPEGFEDEARELVTSLRGLSEELSATADALEEEPAFDQHPISGLEFHFWDRTQAALEALREQGVQVEPLGRHGPAADEQPDEPES